MAFREIKYYGSVGFLYPYDVRHDPGDRAFCNPLPDGSVQLRLATEPAFTEAVLVYNDGDPHAAPMQAAAEAPRVLWGSARVTASGETLIVSDLGAWDGAVIGLAG